jgi:hypothetical protein
MREMRRSVADRATGHSQRSTSGARAPGSTRHWAWEWIKSFLIAFGLFLIIRTFLVEAFRIPTGSMENTLLVGDFLLVNKAVFGTGVPAWPPACRRCLSRNAAISSSSCRRTRLGKNYVKRLVGLRRATRSRCRTVQLFINGLARRMSRTSGIRVPATPTRRGCSGSATTPRGSATPAGLRGTTGDPSSCRPAGTSCSATTATIPRTPVTGDSYRPGGHQGPTAVHLLLVRTRDSGPAPWLDRNPLAPHR